MVCAAVLVCSVILVTFSCDVTAAPPAGAGRSFPIDSENYIIEKFQTINSNLEWDKKNYLVDLAGHYTHCHARDGPLKVDESTLDNRIEGLVGSTTGAGTDTESADTYIRYIVDRWLDSRTYNYLITGSETFGCSVRPGCSGRAVVACLFSYYGQNEPTYPPPNTKRDDIYQPRALAFTQHQYQVAEKATGITWDQSHFLENLSGTETHCDMIGQQGWSFPTAQSAAKKYGVKLVEQYGSARNTGSTDEALKSIIRDFKQINAAEVGCSIIPDCVQPDGEMFAVISCLYAERQPQRRMIDW